MAKPRLEKVRALFYYLHFTKKKLDGMAYLTHPHGVA